MDICYENNEPSTRSLQGQILGLRTSNNRKKRNIQIKQNHCKQDELNNHTKRTYMPIN